MAGKMKKRKESHLINDLIIVLAIGLFGFFLWYSQTGGGRSASKQRTPKMALENFVLQYKKVRSDLFRPDLARPNGPEPTTIKAINPLDGWKGLDVYFTIEELTWLRDNTNLVSLAWTLQHNSNVDTWKKKSVWERHLIARQAILDGAPAGEFQVVSLKDPDKQGTQEMQINLTGGGALNIIFVRQSGSCRIQDFFGNKGRYIRDSKSIMSQMPPDMQ